MSVFQMFAMYEHQVIVEPLKIQTVLCFRGVNELWRVLCQVANAFDVSTPPRTGESESVEMLLIGELQSSETKRK